MNSQFKGLGVALVTPFDEQGGVDYDSLAGLINYMIDNNSDYLVILGTTGEASTLSIDERYAVLDFAVSITAGRVPIVAGFGGNNTAQVISNIKGYHFRGIDAVLTVNPSYNRPNQEGIFQHFRAIAAHCPVPMVIYNVPSRTGSNIKAATTLRLCREVPQIIGIKEASGDLNQCTEIIKNKSRKDFLVLSGDDLLTLPLIALGGDGVISVVGNAFPNEFSRMVHLALESNFEQAREIHFLLKDFIDLLFIDSNPPGVKAALAAMGLCQNKLRLPLVSVSKDIGEKISNEINSIKYYNVLSVK